MRDFAKYTIRTELSLIDIGYMVCDVATELRHQDLPVVTTIFGIPFIDNATNKEKSFMGDLFLEPTAFTNWTASFSRTFVVMAFFLMSRWKMLLLTAIEKVSFRT